jgi:hypothetical protein
LQGGVWLARISLFRASDTEAREAGEPAVARLSAKWAGSGSWKKPVDDVAKVLHNLVSLLLMQRRRTKRYRVVVMLMVDISSVRCRFGGECVIDL